MAKFRNSEYFTLLTKSNQITGGETSFDLPLDLVVLFGESCKTLRLVGPGDPVKATIRERETNVSGLIFRIHGLSVSCYYF